MQKAKTSFQKSRRTLFSSRNFVKDSLSALTQSGSLSASPPEVLYMSLMYSSIEILPSPSLSMSSSVSWNSANFYDRRLDSEWKIHQMTYSVKMHLSKEILCPEHFIPLSVSLPITKLASLQKLSLNSATSDLIYTHFKSLI